jgi:hypothetical protein
MKPRCRPIFYIQMWTFNSVDVQQPREYTLCATGWAHGIRYRSILSVYLPTLWVLAYFGRPFERPNCCGGNDLLSGYIRQKK